MPLCCRLFSCPMMSMQSLTGVNKLVVFSWAPERDHASITCIMVLSLTFIFLKGHHWSTCAPWTPFQQDSLCTLQLSGTFYQWPLANRWVSWCSRGEPHCRVRNISTTFMSNEADARVSARKGKNTVSFKSFYNLFLGLRNTWFKAQKRRLMPSLNWWIFWSLKSFGADGT